MKIQWLGHSSFKLEESTGAVVVTDPFDSVVGYKMPETYADAVTVSQFNHDLNPTNAILGNPVVINSLGAFEVNGIHILSLRSHEDELSDDQDAKNLVFKFRIDGVDICHLGNITNSCSSELFESIGNVNVLLIPVGGTYTIDAEQAKEYVDFFMPDIVIPMHYKTKDCALNIDKVDEFLKLFDDEDIIYAESNSLDLDRTTFDQESTKVLILKK